jgi:hypothetical protein
VRLPLHMFDISCAVSSPRTLLTLLLSVRLEEEMDVIRRSASVVPRPSKGHSAC